MDEMFGTVSIVHIGSPMEREIYDFLEGHIHRTRDRGFQMLMFPEQF